MLERIGEVSMVDVICQYCKSRIDLNREPAFGDHLLCRTCNIEYMIAWLNPIELSPLDGDIYEDMSYLDRFEKIKKKGEFHDYR